ncbi:MAG: alpha/beta hydrolase [Acidimicrobiaceae bacterium]|nr:alpha/beta hydrolase [Acidimicrobiaceae bacterium]HBU74691.1 alpha/beta hydrolase [Acidimicrobiaceae bacterium]
MQLKTNRPPMRVMLRRVNKQCHIGATVVFVHVLIAFDSERRNRHRSRQRLFNKRRLDASRTMVYHALLPARYCKKVSQSGQHLSQHSRRPSKSSCERTTFIYMATAAVNGIEINYRDTGGDGPVVLFSHGFMMNHTMFDAQLEALAPDYRCVAWDERGFGGTRATGPFTYWDSANDALALLDHLGIKQAVLAGMSQGGFLSMRAALTAPERVSGLIFIDSAADLDDPETLEGNQKMVHVFANGDDETRSFVFDIVGNMILGDEHLEAEWKPIWAQLDIDQIELAGATLLGRDDLVDRLGEISCPTLVIHGTEDAAISLDRGYLLANGVRDSRGVVEVAGAAHAPNMTHPDEVNVAIREFLQSL